MLIQPGSDDEQVWENAQAIIAKNRAGEFRHGISPAWRLMVLDTLEDLVEMIEESSA